MSRGYDLVAVCSYGRSGTVARDTLRTMLEGGVPPEKLKVFTPQVEEYREALEREGLEVGVLEAEKGLHNAQNGVLRESPVGHRIVFADDDVRGVDRLSGGRKPGLVRETALGGPGGLFERAFDAADREKVTLWGLYPVHNAFYMKRVTRVGLWFCIGQLFGVCVTEDRQYGTEEASKKGDYERTLMHFERDGGVLRMDWAASDCAPMRTAAGGNATPERAAEERRAVDSLKRRWPGLVHDKPERQGFPEIALRLPQGK